MPPEKEGYFKRSHWKYSFSQSIYEYLLRYGHELAIMLWPTQTQRWILQSVWWNGAGSIAYSSVTHKPQETYVQKYMGVQRGRYLTVCGRGESEVVDVWDEARRRLLSGQGSPLISFCLCLRRVKLVGAHKKRNNPQLGKNLKEDYASVRWQEYPLLRSQVWGKTLN